MTNNVKNGKLQRFHFVHPCSLELPAERNPEGTELGKSTLARLCFSTFPIVWENLLSWQLHWWFNWFRFLTSKHTPRLIRTQPSLLTWGLQWPPSPTSMASPSPSWRLPVLQSWFSTLVFQKCGSSTSFETQTFVEYLDEIIFQSLGGKEQLLAEFPTIKEQVGWFFIFLLVGGFLFYKSYCRASNLGFKTTYCSCFSGYHLNSS